MRKGNEKFNTMITEQLMAQEDIRRAAEAEAKVTKQTICRQSHEIFSERGVLCCCFFHAERAEFGA